MDGEAACVADIGHMIEQLKGVDELAANLAPAHELEPDKAAIATRQILVGSLSHRPHLDRRVDDLRDVLSAFQELDHCLSIGAVPRHPKRKRLHALQELEGIEGRHRRAEVSQQDDACAYRVCDRAQPLHCVAPDRAVVTRIRGVEERLAFGIGFPVEIAAVNQDPAD